MRLGQQQLRRAVVERLEARQLLSTYYVSPEGDDAGDGSEAEPWKTLQKAADMVAAGDVVNVADGDYAGFALGVDRAVSGTAERPIVFRKYGDVVDTPWIETRNPHTNDGIYIAPGTDHVKIKGFRVHIRNAPALRSGIRVTKSDHVVLRGNMVTSPTGEGISVIRSDDATILNNAVLDDATTGISVLGGDRAVVHGNSVSGGGDIRYGIALLADGTGGAGLVYDATVTANYVSRASDEGIRVAGVKLSTFVNNRIVNGLGGGLVLRDVPGVGGSKDNLVVNNTILLDAEGGWALKLTGRTAYTTVLNNILAKQGAGGGSLLLSSDSARGLDADFNVHNGAISPDGGETRMTLKGWRAAFGQNAESFVASLGTVLLDEDGFAVSPRGPAVNAGTNRHAPDEDWAGAARDGRPDIGAAELAPDRSSLGNWSLSDGVFENVTHQGHGLGLTPALYYDGSEYMVEGVTVDEERWETLAWPDDGAGFADDGGFGMELREASIRSTRLVSSSLQIEIISAPESGGIFGIGTNAGEAAGNYWAAFVTREGQLYAQVNMNGAIQEVAVAEHQPDHALCRIERTASGFKFLYRPRTDEPWQTAMLAGEFPAEADLRVVAGNETSDPMFVNRVTAGPFNPVGQAAFDVVDGRISGAWGLFEFEADLPKDTGIVIRTRSGETSVVDDSWSDWEALRDDGQILSPAGRYLQYQVTFTSNNPQRTPTLRSVSIGLYPFAL